MARHVSSCAAVRHEDHDPSRPFTCDGKLWRDGAELSVTGGCGEPCSWIMRKHGHGVPPFPDALDTRLETIRMLERIAEAEFGYGDWPAEAEIRELIAAARGANYS
jgi:hypothetical protein